MPFSEMFGTFALSVGAAVSSRASKSTTLELQNFSVMKFVV